jgi:AraC-like DNA-binding protein
MSCVQLTASGHIRPIVTFLAERGEPVQPLLEKAGLPNNCLENPKAPVPTASLWHFRDLAAACTGSPNLTLQVMRAWELPELGDVGRALIGGPTLRRTILDFGRLAHAESSTVVIELRPWHGESEFFSNRFLLKHDQGEWQAELYLLAWMLKIVWLVDPTWSPTEIWCTASQTKERLQAIESLGARPRFNRRCIGFPVPVSMLAMSPICSWPSQRNRDLAERVLWSASPSASAAGAIRQVIRTYSDDRWLTIDEASDALGTSPRTLQRELAAEGKTYSEILKEIRAESARNLLGQTDASLSEIAEQLGYGNLSNFNRAFRRWAAVSPMEFRRQWRGAASSRH